MIKKIILILMIFNFTSTLSANYHELAYSFKFKGIDGKEINLNDYEGKVVVIVNVASRCGYTPQYAGLQTLWSNYKKDLVVIENQPALKNPTMKSIQMIIYSYFLIHGVCNDISTIQDIQMINARNKLKAYKGPKVECDIKDRYKKTKFLGIEYCKYMINDSLQDEQWIQLFTNSKKKDDLADAYLQGMYVLNNIH